MMAAAICGAIAPADQCLDKIGPRIGTGADNGESLKLRRLSACGLLLPVKLTLSGPSLAVLSMGFPRPANLRCQARLPVCAELARPPSHRSRPQTQTGLVQRDRTVSATPGRGQWLHAHERSPHEGVNHVQHRDH
jgi:hypothetical protein